MTEQQLGTPVRVQPVVGLCGAETSDRNRTRHKCGLPVGHDGQHASKGYLRFRWGRKNRKSNDQAQRPALGEDVNCKPKL